MNRILNCGYEIKWSYDLHRRNECYFHNCVEKPEKFMASTGFAPVTSQCRCDTTSNLLSCKSTGGRNRPFVGSTLTGQLWKLKPTELWSEATDGGNWRYEPTNKKNSTFTSIPTDILFLFEYKALKFGITFLSLCVIHLRNGQYLASVHPIRDARG